MGMKEGGLFVRGRPQISIEIDEFNEISITVASIGDDSKTVEINTVRFPIECADDVVRAILDFVWGH